MVFCTALGHRSLYLSGEAAERACLGGLVFADAPGASDKILHAASSMEHEEPGMGFTSPSSIVDRMLSETSKTRLPPIRPLSQEEMLQNLRRGRGDFAELEQTIASLERDNELATGQVVKLLSERR